MDRIERRIMSYALSFSATDPAKLWTEAGDAAAALVAGERDGIANMANVAALIWQAIPDLNWAGFYRFDGTELVLGPFQGKAARTEERGVGKYGVSQCRCRWVPVH